MGWLWAGAVPGFPAQCHAAPRVIGIPACFYLSLEVLWPWEALGFAPVLLRRRMLGVAALGLPGNPLACWCIAFKFREELNLV